MNKCKNIKHLFVDCDGTLTDGIYLVSSSGTITKGFYSQDFHALYRLNKSGIKIYILTGADDGAVEQKLATSSAWKHMTVISNSSDKRRDVQDMVDAGKMSWDEIAVMGDGLNDYQVMKAAAFAACPFNSEPEIVEISDFCSNRYGGSGAVADFVRYFLDQRGESFILDSEK